MNSKKKLSLISNEDKICSRSRSLRKQSLLTECLTGDYESIDKIKSTKDSYSQCLLIDYKINVKLASYLSIAKNAVFIEFEAKNNETFCSSKFSRATAKEKKQLLKRNIGIQTYSTQVENQSTAENLIEEIIFDLLIKNNLNLTNLTLSQFINCLEKLTYKSVLYLFNNLNELHQIDLIESLIKLNRTNKLKLLDLSINKHKASDSNLSDSNESSLKKVIAIAETSRLGVRFNSNEEKRKQALNRFKRAVRFVIINKEFLKSLTKENNTKEEHFKLLSEYNRIENSAEFNKKIQMLFNKDDFKAQRNVNSLISDIQRKILTKAKYKRTTEQLESLQEILSLIPKLNSLPKHLFVHVAQLLTLIVFEKGREIVREGHKAIGFYFIINGCCDVFSVNKDGLLKIEELSSGDTFGENSFKETNAITPHTIITNKRTELIMVMPSDIENYLTKLHENEREQIENFITNWWLAKYWNWSQENMDSFIKNAQFIRYSDGEIILDSTIESFDKLYFILKGNVELIRLLNTKKKSATNQKLIRICKLEKNNYFGVEDQLNVNAWYLAVGDTDLIAIDKSKFLSIHKHSYFLLSQLVEDFKLAVPSSDKEINSYFKKL